MRSRSGSALAALALALAALALALAVLALAVPALAARAAAAARRLPSSLSGDAELLRMLSSLALPSGKSKRG